MLNKKQLTTVADLIVYEGIKSAEDIVKWATTKLTQKRQNSKKSKKNRRSHSKTHYQGILEHYLPLCKKS